MTTRFEPGNLFAYEQEKQAKQEQRWAEAACWALIDTVEVTGGINSAHELAADREWLDVADAYLLACRAVDHQPRILKGDEESEEPDDEKPVGPRCRCDNCGWSGSIDDTNPVRDLWERVEPGGVMPAGECPECGALAYPEEKDDDS